MDYASLGATASFLVEIGKVVVPVGVGFGAAYKWAKPRYEELRNRQFHHWIVSATTVTEPDENGFRRLVLDNLGGEERFDDAVRGSTERRWMEAAAKKCTWEPDKRFLRESPERLAGIFHVTRNALTKFWAVGVKAKLARQPVCDTDLYFSITGADAAEGRKNKFRVIIMNEHDLRIVLEHPEDKWLFDEPHHRLRLETCRIMADAWFNRGGFLEVDGVKYKIVGWLRGTAHDNT